MTMDLKEAVTGHRGFGSDNHAGVHPDIFQAMLQANVGHAPSYGTDEISKASEDIFRKHFGDVETHFVFNGTAANVLCVRAATRSFHAVLCANTAHLNVDECGAPEFFTGCKLLVVPHVQGKVTTDALKVHLIRGGDQHYAQPRLLSITQPTELGTVYSVDELRAIINFAHQNNLLVHMDGARLVNAAAFLNVSLKALTADVGVDILSFGGTKNALLYGEAIVIFNRELRRDFRFMRKQAMQLCSKTRFVAAQFNALLGTDLWLNNAHHAVSMAKLLAEKLRDVPHIEITQPVQANAVFAKVPWPIIKKAREEYFFYVWDERTGEVRLMTSFDTTEDDVLGLARALAK